MQNISNTVTNLSKLDIYSDLDVVINIDNKNHEVKAITIQDNTLYLLDSFFSGSFKEVEECHTSLEILDYITYNSSFDKVVFCKGKNMFDIVGAGVSVDLISFSNNIDFVQEFNEVILLKD